jgi:hypothetical protein
MWRRLVAALRGALGRSAPRDFAGVFRSALERGDVVTLRASALERALARRSEPRSGDRAPRL